MAFIPAVNVMKVALELVQDSQLMALTFNFLKGSAVVPADLSAMATAMATWYTTYLKPQLVNTCSLTGVRVTDQTNLSAPSFFLPISPPEAGTLAGTPEPNNVAVVVTERTNFRGRSYRGRNYVPGQGQNQQVSPTIIALGQATALAGAWAQLSTVETATSTLHVVVSRYANGAPRLSAVMSEITSYTVDQKYDSQRRRLAGRGA